MLAYTARLVGCPADRPTFERYTAVLVNVGGMEDVFHQVVRILERCEAFSGALAFRDQQTHGGSS